jgi:hypothetical protein
MSSVSTISRFEKAANKVCRPLSVLLHYLPERFSFRLSKIRLIRRAALRNLGKKWSKDDSKFSLAERGKVIKLGDSACSRPVGRNNRAYNDPYPGYVVLHKQNGSLAGRRVALMAHYDPHNTVDPYVVNYLHHLRAIGYEPVLATCAGLSLTAELKSLLLAAVARLGPGYDFTSWQAAFIAFPELMRAKELLLCNDSVFAPIGSFLPIHEQMEKVACDFWGLCESREYNPHLQSYYMIFRERALLSPSFKKFWSALRVENRKEAIASELRLASALASDGLTPGAYITSECTPFNKVSPIHLFWKPLIQWFDIPCIKRDLLKEGGGWIDVHGWRDLLADKGYDLSLIDNYFARLNPRVSE